MARTKLERIAGIEEEIRQLENQRKQLMQQHKEQERREREPTGYVNAAGFWKASYPRR